MQSVQPKGTPERRDWSTLPPPHRRRTSHTIRVKPYQWHSDTEWSINGRFNAENHDNLQMNNFIGQSQKGLRL